MSRPRGTKRLVVAVKVVLTALILAFVGRHVARTWADLKAHGDLPRIEVVWLMAGAGLYLLGLAVLGLYFARVLRAGAVAPVGVVAAVRAYLISHLGKYVPGKALVVVMRVGLLAPHGGRPATVAFAAIYETFVMMAAGGLIAAAGFAAGSAATVQVPVGPGRRLDLPLALLGLAAGLAFLGPALPSVFARLSRLMSLPFPNVGPEALPRLSGRLLGEGLILTAIGWVLLGLSQVAVIRALVPAGVPAGAWPLVVASVALATVAGFAVPVAPGGLGVREYVLWTALGTAVDHDRAVLSSLALRMTWVVGELLAAAVVLPLARPARVRAEAEMSGVGPA